MVSLDVVFVMLSFIVNTSTVMWSLGFIKGWVFVYAFTTRVAWAVACVACVHVDVRVWEREKESVVRLN